MHTKDKLAAALREAGLGEMADKAATGFYHDYLSPLDLPELQLLSDLVAASKDHVLYGPVVRHAARDLAICVQNGDFDASQEESEAWADSPEGQDTFRKLIEGR